MKTPREVLLNRHGHVEPKLDRMWTRIAARPAVAPYQLLTTLWRELIWPCRKTWAALACAWVVIALLNFASSEPAARVVSKTTPRSREEMQALIEQRQLLAQMIEPLAETAGKPKSNPSGPRSDRGGRISAA